MSLDSTGKSMSQSGENCVPGLGNGGNKCELMDKRELAGVAEIGSVSPFRKITLAAMRGMDWRHQIFPCKQISEMELCIVFCLFISHLIPKTT